jgi:hypothetical protein
MSDFTRYWKKGWKVMVLLALCNAVAGLLGVGLFMFLARSSATLAFIFASSFGLIVMPALFYWFHVGLFGETSFRSKSIF